MTQLTLIGARTLLGWTQQKLADESGLKKQLISDLETGSTKAPGYVTVIRIVKALQRGGMPGLQAEDIFPVPDDVPEPQREAVAP